MQQSTLYSVVRSLLRHLVKIWRPLLVFSGYTVDVGSFLLFWLDSGQIRRLDLHVHVVYLENLGEVLPDFLRRRNRVAGLPNMTWIVHSQTG